jgi:hypothetical protein
MAEKLIGSLIYGEHLVPKRRPPLRERLKVPLAIGAVILLVGLLAYRFANYREEGRIRSFLADLRAGQYDAAYAQWDTDGHYSLKDFVADWGKNGYYSKDIDSARIHTRLLIFPDSNTSGSAVVVYVDLNGFKAPLPVRVDKGNLKLSYSPVNKYTR